MTPQKEFGFSVGLALVLLLIGIVGYAAFPVKTPEHEPVRQLFCFEGECAAGQVLFDHRNHTRDASCSSCHHHPVEDETGIRPCGDCHRTEIKAVVQQACLECHSPGEAHHPDVEYDGAYTCAQCHTPDDGQPPRLCMDCHDEEELDYLPFIKMDMPGRADAFHRQCEECHREYDVGPKEEDRRCDWCHFRKM